MRWFGSSARATESGRNEGWSLTIPAHIAQQLKEHLFPGDQDEHGAAIIAGVVEGPNGPRLLARDVVFARDGIDYVPGKRGYRMLTGEFVTRQIIRCRDESSVYLAIHNHGGHDSVAFSGDDYRSHQRGYPALLGITRDRPVGALVFAENAVAGVLWLSPTKQIPLRSTTVLGTSRRILHAAPPPRSPGRDATYDRQARVFGDKGQDMLSRAKVGVIGAGGVGSLVVEYLGRLGVGHIVTVDPQRVDLTNVPRITGATMWDACAFLTKEGRPEWMKKLGRRLSTQKVSVMKRIILRANPNAKIEAIFGDFVDDDIARRFTDCDYLFLAADSMQARLVFNALVHGYLIPGVQMGAKVIVDPTTGAVEDVYTVVRPVTPSHGCLLCNGLIPAAALQHEAETAAERKVQRYVDDENVIAPSVITLNATTASHAVNDFLFMFTGLASASARTDYMRIKPMTRTVVFDEPRASDTCPHCSPSKLGIFGRGDDMDLPSRERSR